MKIFLFDANECDLYILLAMILLEMFFHTDYNILFGFCFIVCESVLVFVAFSTFSFVKFLFSQS